MKQEVVIAIAAGFLIGAGVAFGIVHVSSTVKNKSTTATSPTPSSQIAQTTPATTSTTASGLDISEPADETVVDSKTIKVNGKAQPSNTIVVETDEDTQAKRVGNDGSFSIPIALSEGNNTITISSYNDTGEEQTKTLSVFYTSEKI